MALFRWFQQGFRETVMINSRRQYPEPETLAEWQDAVDLAEVYLQLDSARAYGLVIGGPAVNVQRCEDLLRRALAFNIRPAADAIERCVPLLLAAAQSGN